MGLGRLAGCAATLAVVAFVGCSTEPSGPEGGVAGNWSVNATIDGTQCGDPIITANFTIRISQTGNALAVTVDGDDFNGTLNGTQGTWSGSYPDTGGTTTETYTVTFAGNNTTMTGGSTWSWSDGTTTCPGTSTLTGSK